MLALDIPKTQYVSARKAGSFASFEPYADPFDGPMYGHKRGPAIALVGAAGAIGAGASIGGLVGGLMIAGGIASGLGAITGNQTLSTIGMGLSLAGGIGTAFVDQAGNFMNPFAEGTNFSDSVMGGAFSKVKSFFSDVTGGGTSAADSLGISGDSIADSAIPDTSAPAMTQGIIDAAPKQGLSLGGAGINGGASVAAQVAKPSGGLLSSLTGNQGTLGMLNGLNDGYNKYEERKQAQPYVDAKVNSEIAGAAGTQAQTQLLQDRYRNMQGQPDVQLGVNQNAQVFNQQPGSGAGKYAVVMNGEVKYLNQAEYDQMRQAQSGGGLITQGGA